jgi:hypothetical protein
VENAPATPGASPSGNPVCNLGRADTLATNYIYRTSAFSTSSYVRVRLMYERATVTDSGAANTFQVGIDANNDFTFTFVPSETLSTPPAIAWQSRTASTGAAAAAALTLALTLAPIARADGVSDAIAGLPERLPDTRVITAPGVQLDDEMLDPKTARYVAAVVPGPRADETFGFAYLDVSTGEFRATEVEGAVALASELARVAPREVLAAPRDVAAGGALAGVRRRFSACAWTEVAPTDDSAVAGVLEEALCDSLRGLGLGERPLAARGAADVVRYARATQPAGALPLTRLEVYRPGEAVVLDEAATVNLELCATIMEGKKRGSLLGVIDRTRTWLLLLQKPDGSWPMPAQTAWSWSGLQGEFVVTSYVAWSLAESGFKGEPLEK